MKKYKVVDLYNGKEMLGYADNLNEVKKIARRQLVEADGECAIYYYPYDGSKKKYDFSKRVFLQSC